MSAARKQTSRKTAQELKLKTHDVIQCRGAAWRYLREQNGFWEIELVRQGSHFSEVPVRVWALPNLEEVAKLKGPEVYCPTPTLKQLTDTKLYKAALDARKRTTIEITPESKAPKTAAGCAIVYKEWQFEPWYRIVDQLPFPRLLIADDVGLGKTTEAAIILAELTRRRRADRVLIVAPQHLTEKWQSELFNRFGLAFEIFDRTTRERMSERGVTNPWEIVERVIVSRDFVKRWENLKPISHVEWDMVVIDECHHFVKDESGQKNRLREFAEKIAYKSPGLLLLSATPFTGAHEEFQSLLTLLDPKFQSEKTAKWDPNSPYLVRRLKRHVKAQGEKIMDRKVIDIKITDEDLSKAEREAFELVIEDLAAQKHTATRQTWDRLLEEVARKRLSSSWQAFSETISGDGKLSTWFAEKTKSKVSKLCENFDSAKLKRLTATLKEIAKEDPKAKTVIFTEAIASQVMIQQYLIQKAGFAANQVAIIDGSTQGEDRLIIEDGFADPTSPLRVLIATDTIAEGKDLQHACHHLIHFELPWSLVKLEQRNGRIDRLGQTKTPTIYNLVLETKATPDQRVMKLLSKKVERAHDALGSVSPILESLNVDFLESAVSENKINEIEAEIDAQIEYMKSFGLDATSVTPLSPAPKLKSNEGTDRRMLFDIMITNLGGKLEPLGSNDKEAILSVPRGWTLPRLVIDTFGYPSEESQWRVTFDAEHYLKYEKFMREGGAAKTALQFLGPVHPLVLQVESRFRHGMNRQAYPIFGVRNANAKSLVVVEFTLRSKTGRIAAQEMRTYSLTDKKRVQGRDLDVVEPGRQLRELPHMREWDTLHPFLENELKAFASEIDDAFKDKRARYTEEQQKLDKTVHGAEARGRWIEDLWSIDSEQANFQISALLINQESR